MSPENPTAGEGPVVLDIGGEIGALVVSLPDELLGAEVEICPAGRRGSRPDEGRGWWSGRWRDGHHGAVWHDADHAPAWPHVGIVGRRTARGMGAAAVFPGLRQGCYELWLRPDEPTGVVAAVRGGEVTTAAWPR